MSQSLTTFRAVKAIHLNNGDDVAAAAYAKAQKGWRFDLEDVLSIIRNRKAAVLGLESGEVGLFDRFLHEITSQSVVGRLPGLRRTAPMVRMLTATGKVRAGIVGEGKAIPAVKGGFAPQWVELLTIAALTVASDQALEDSAAEAGIAADLSNACIDVLNEAFLVGAASITAGVTPIDTSVASISELDIALKAAIAAQSNVLTSAWVMPAWLAADLSLARGTGGAPAYPDVTVRGGEIAGMPVLVTAEEKDSDGGTIRLVDGDLIVFSEREVEVTTSKNALIEMNTAPTGDTTTPTAASKHYVSMFQSDAVALRAALEAGWLVRRSGGVQTITGVEL